MNTMLRESTRETLEMVVEKANLMRSRAYWQFFREGREIGLRFGIDPVSDALIDVEFIGPNEEARDALLVTLRLFIQDNERISLKNLAKLSAEDSELSSDWNRSYASIRGEANELLDESLTLAAQQVGMSDLTGRELLDTFLYGEIAHMNPDKRRCYRSWNDLPVFPFLEFCFSAVITGLLCVIFNAAALAKDELTGQVC